MTFFVTALRENPELAIFLTLAVGFVIGRIRIGSFSLGNVVGTLLAGVVIGQLDIKVDPLVKTVFFDLFLFATGYKVGPAVLPRPQEERRAPGGADGRALRDEPRDDRDRGEDPRVRQRDRRGADGRRLHRVDRHRHRRPDHRAARPPGRRRSSAMLNNIPVAYAVSYLVGTGFVVWFLSSLAPRLLKVDLKAESRKLEAGDGRRDSGPRRGGQSAYREWDLRAFRLDATRLRHAGASRTSSGRSPRTACSSSGSARAAPSSRPNPARRCRPGDTVVVGARRHVHARRRRAASATEVEDRELLDFPVAAMDVVLTTRGLADRTLADSPALHGRGVVLSKLVRGGEEIPFAADTVLNRGDLLRIAGAKSDVERAGTRARLHRAAVERDRRRLRGPRHPARRARRAR